MYEGCSNETQSHIWHPQEGTNGLWIRPLEMESISWGTNGVPVSVLKGTTFNGLYTFAQHNPWAAFI
jgi:hypothetical protein